MQKYQSIISGTNGSVIRNVPVTVLKEDGSLAEIFLDREGQVQAPNPLVTDSRGVFYFYAVNGRYSLRTSVDGITITDADAVLLNDPEEIATAGPIADAVLRAEAAAQRAEFAVEASGIPELVGAAQNAVLDANAALQGAQSAAQLADDAKTQAASAKNAAELAQLASDTAKTGAENAQSLAELAADQARVYAESIDPAQFVQKEVGKDLMTEVERDKLANIAEQATKNATDANLRDRATHTGTQAIATVTGLQTALDSKLPSSGGVLSGNITVPSLNGGQLAGMRNKIINGSFRVWQRGTSGISVAGSETYTADRWFAVAAGANLTAFRSDYNDGNATSLVIQGASSNTMCDIGQRIEGVNTEDLAGKVVTLSCEVFRQDTGNVTWEARYANAVDNFTTTTLISSGTIAVTGGTFAFAEVNFTVPSAVAHHGIEIRFKYGALAATEQVALRRVQLEVGSVATPFEHRHFGFELALCQRYYLNAVNTVIFGCASIANGSVLLSETTASVIFPVTMRAAPTVNFLATEFVFSASIGNATAHGFTASLVPSGAAFPRANGFLSNIEL